MSTVLTAREPSARYLVQQPPLVQHFELMANARGGVARLRELILTLAVQGKLVPQDASDEPASELLKKIRAEKDRLIDEGKIKRDKPQADIRDEETPFELPIGWKWSKLGALTSKLTDGSHNPPRDSGTGYPMLSSQNVWEGGIIDFTSPSRYVSESDFAIENRRTTATPNDVLLTIVASLGRSAVVPNNAPAFVLQRSVAVIRTNLVPAFLSLFLRSPIARAFYDLHGKGTAQKGIYLGKLSTMPIPVPPLAEQSRIVTRVEKLMRLCDALEAKDQLEGTQHVQLVSTLLGTLTDSDTPAQLADNWHRIATHFDLLLDRPEAVDALEQTILQLAVRGLLVPQDLQDEPASELLKKIRTEKDKPIAEGKIKRDNPLPPIGKDEQPFVLPAGWVWVRMGDVFDGGSGTTPLRARADYFAEGTEMWVKTTDLTNGLVTTCEELVTKAAVVENRLKYFPAGTVCVAMYGGAGTIGKSGVLGVASTINQSVFALPPIDGIDSGYLHTYVITVRSQWMSFAAGLRKDPNINGQITKRMVMPLPPLSEQSRIVSRVGQLRRLCADLRQRLAASQSTQAHLAEALVQEVA